MSSTVNSGYNRTNFSTKKEPVKGIMRGQSLNYSHKPNNQESEARNSRGEFGTMKGGYK